ncbi:hypothetical protein Tco_1353035 [Tanacetum coccineum]
MHTTPIYSNCSWWALPAADGFINNLQHPTQTSAYNSFPGLQFDSQGFPIPCGSNGAFLGPFQTGEKQQTISHDYGETQGCDDVPRGSSPVLVSMDVGQRGTVSSSGTARDYITMFEKMAAQLPRLQEEVLEGIFIKGLKQELRTAVRTQKPTGLSQAMELALIIDETNKKAKGFCYRCDGKFLPGHRCPEKALQLLLVDDDEEEEIEGGYDEEHEVVFQGGGDDMNPLTWSIVNYVSQRN